MFHVLSLRCKLCAIGSSTLTSCYGSLINCYSSIGSSDWLIIFQRSARQQSSLRE